MAAVEPLEERQLLSATLVADFDTAPADSSPDQFVELNGSLYFFANDAAGGRELWKTDGTTAGTVRVKDTIPGSTDGVGVNRFEPPDMVRVGDTLYFPVSQPLVADSALWRSDGTEAGTTIVSKVGDTEADIGGMVEVNGTLFFTAMTRGRRALFKSDGTAAGTVRVGAVSNLAPSPVARPVAIGDTLYFAADSGGSGPELWKTDGTDAGTVLLKDVVPGAGGSRPASLTVVGGTLFFAATSPTGAELWKSDGTEAGTVRVAAALPLDSGPPSLCNLNGTLFFNNGGRLFKTDGTPAGTVEIKPGPTWVSQLAAFGGRLYFVNGGGTLWQSDGTAAGTRMVASVLPGRIGSLADAGGRLTFSVGPYAPGDRAAPGATSLWVSDGTAAGTVQLHGEVPPEPTFSSMWHEFAGPRVAALGGSLFFSGAGDGAGFELWRSDGTPDGAARVSDIYPGTRTSDPYGLVARGGDVFFATDSNVSRNVAASSPTRHAVWKSDGTDAGTVLLRSEPGESYSSLVVAGDVAYFAVSGGATPGLWRSDGTAAGTSLVLNPGAAASCSPDATVGDLLLFHVTRFSAPFETELWVTDGTPAGTKPLRAFKSLSFYLSVAAGSSVYFDADDGQSGRELWVTDGTAEGTRLAADSNPGPGGSSIVALSPVGDSVLFTTGGGGVPDTLWSVPGTAAAPRLLMETCSSRHAYLQPTQYQGTAWFSVYDQASGTSIWKSDGTPGGTAAVATLDAQRKVGVGNFAAYHGALYFSAGGVLWRTDGTESGTGPAPAGDNPPSAVSLVGVVGEELLFVADRPETGRELWQTDGTAVGTVLVADVFPGPDASKPQTVTLAGDTACFTAFDPQHGRELWKYTPDPATPPARVVGRNVFYSASAFDADGSAPGAGDDAAVATDKSALLPGQAASFANVTSYSRGINGVMVDVSDLHGDVTADDFEFTVVSTGGLAGRVVAPAPKSVTVRRGAGAGGSDRVTLVWADDLAVRNAWLSVTLKSNARTALLRDDVFSFGNLIGESGDAVASGSPLRVNALDLGGVKRELNAASSLTGRYDFNRDGRVNALDLGIVKRYLNETLAAVPLPPPPAAIASPEPAAETTSPLKDAEDAVLAPR